jgi:hypothetical protein
LQKDAVIEYLQMPERVKSLERNFDVFASKFDELAGVLKHLLDLEGQDARSVSEDQRRLPDYVS